MLPFTLPAVGGYVVALSGGADSRLLLELTVRAVLARGGEPAEELRAAHLNHGLRGEEADRDEAFCRRICAERGIPLHVERADIPARCRESGQSEETAAREARYAFLIRVMKETGCPALLTAHNADDQLETLLFHLLRGSGTRGMIGIPAERSLGETLSDGTPLVVYRPLLSWSRREILDGIAELGLCYVTDSTNLADDCVRNRLRHQAVPALEAILGAGVPQSAAVRLGAAAAEDEAALASLAAERYSLAVTAEGLSAAAVAAEPPAIGKRMLRRAYEAQLADTLSPERTLSAHHLDALLALCRYGTDGQVSTPLPGQRRAELHGGYLTFSPSAPPKAPAPPLPLRPLPPGVTVWLEASPRITVEVETVTLPASPVQDASVFASACFPAAIAPTLAARGRQAGDLILSHGMTKKLKKLICDKHIPVRLRDVLPLICLSDGTPLWFPAVAYRDGFRPPADGTATRITVRIHDSAR